MYNLCVCAVFKNEAHILYEWITHYLNRGVDHIYLINDFSNDNFQEIISKFGNKVTLFHNDIITDNCGRQPILYEKYFRPILNTTKWVAILDLDEFLYSPETSNLPTILERYNNYSQLVVYWLFFGSNGHIYQPQSVVEGFQYRNIVCTDHGSWHSGCKAICKADSITSFGIHSQGVKETSIDLTPDSDGLAPLIINHYNIQSLSYFLSIKATRGDCDNYIQTTSKRRDIRFFKEYDNNIIKDNRLAIQNDELINIVKTNKITTGDNVTLCITSCNRAHLLDKTLESFVKYNTYPIKETYIIDDSGKVGCNDEVIAKYNDILNIKPIYNQKNIGQIQSIDKMYSYVTTPWIFHCEEDWEFLQPEFIEKSMKIFNEDPDDRIFTVSLRPHNDTNGHPIEYDSLNRGYYEMSRYFSYMWDNIEIVWGGATLNPGLRRTSTCLKHHPYSEKCEKIYRKGAYHADEYTINKKYRLDGYYICILDDPNGHVKHIGNGHHVHRDGFD
jgi:hypothetical protein